jgi:hypothetical protein
VLPAQGRRWWIGETPDAFRGIPTRTRAFRPPAGLAASSTSPGEASLSCRRLPQVPRRISHGTLVSARLRRLAERIRCAPRNAGTIGHKDCAVRSLGIGDCRVRSLPLQPGAVVEANRLCECGSKRPLLRTSVAHGDIDRIWAARSVRDADDPCQTGGRGHPAELDGCRR